MWKSPPRTAETTIVCNKCGEKLTAQRSCHEAYLTCKNCQAEFTVSEYISKMDNALEHFLEELDCDRV